MCAAPAERDNVVQCPARLAAITARVPDQHRASLVEVSGLNPGARLTSPAQVLRACPQRSRLFRVLAKPERSPSPCGGSDALLFPVVGILRAPGAAYRPMSLAIVRVAPAAVADPAKSFDERRLSATIGAEPDEPPRRFIESSPSPGAASAAETTPLPLRGGLVRVRFELRAAVLAPFCYTDVLKSLRPTARGRAEPPCVPLGYRVARILGDGTAALTALARHGGAASLPVPRTSRRAEPPAHPLLR